MSTSLLIITIIGVLAVVVHRRRSRPDWPARLAPVLLTAWLVTPLIGVVVLTIAYRPLLVPRYLGYCLPPLVVLVAAALVRLRAAAMVAGLSMALLLSLAFDLTWYRAGPKEGWRPLVAEVAARRGVADEILFYPAYSRLPFDYYQSRFPGGAVMEPVYPAQASGVGGGLAALGPVPIGRSVVAASARNVPRLWLVVRRDQAGPSTREQAVHAGLGDAGLVAVRQACYGRACYAEYQRPGRPAL
jgi:hypothetical protein